MNRMIKRMALPVGAAVILGSSGFAFMAQSNVDASYAGSGTNTISGYNVHNVTYDFPSLKNSQSQPINSVSFTLDGPAKDVDAWISQPAGHGGSVQYDNCAYGSVAAGYWTCTPSGPTKAAIQYANGLTVSAAQ